METKQISRRQFVKGTGALIVSFNLLGPVSRVLAQSETFAGNEPEATSLDSWIAVARDGTVTVFTSKVDLGTGVVTALSQIVAEELDVPFHQIHMETGDTSQTIDQAATVGSRTIERGGPQLRQASAAARQQLLKLASVKLGSPAEKLDSHRWRRERLWRSGEESVLREPRRWKTFRRPDNGHGRRRRDDRGSGSEAQGSQGLQDCRQAGAPR